MLAMAVSAQSTVIQDWEGGAPGFFVYAGPGGSVEPFFVNLPEGDPEAIPGTVGDNTVLGVNYDNPGTFGGFGDDYALAGIGAQDWSGSNALRFWMFGTNTGNSLQFEILDNSFDGTTGNSERFDTALVDDFFGWQQVTLRFDAFARAVDFQPPGALDDGLTLTAVNGWAVVLDNNTGGIGFDRLELVNVPTPGALALLSVGLMGMGLARRRRRAA